MYTMRIRPESVPVCGVEGTTHVTRNNAFVGKAFVSLCVKKAITSITRLSPGVRV